MTDINVIKLAQPGTFTDSLTEILRDGARALLAQAVETEVADFLGRYADLKTAAGHQRVVRHGHLPERIIGTEDFFPIRRSDTCWTIHHVVAA